MRRFFVGLAAAAALAVAGPSAAQIERIDPDAAGSQPAETQSYEESNELPPPPDTETSAYEAAAAPSAEAPAAAAERTPRHEEIVHAAEDLFGRGAEGLGGLVERILRDQGEPTAYIAGRETSGALILGVRYGEGTLRHAVEGERPVFWRGPSIGFDAGAEGSKVFVLVYNLHDSQDLFRRFPGASGHAYLLGGFTAQYMRRGDIVLIPIRLGVGVRLGVNAGYMRFSERSRWLPF